MDFKDRLLKWRSQNWPPVAMQQCSNLPIYIGEHDQVQEFSEKLAETMEKAASHIYDHGKRVPRWMQVPKIIFNVERVNVVSAKSKTSKKCDSIKELTSKCGEFEAKYLSAVNSWLASAPKAGLVAHKSIVDLRAYVFIKDHELPIRRRFLESGMVLAIEKNFILQDHREQVRKTRSDRYINSLAVNDGGWEVFGKIWA